MLARRYVELDPRLHIARTFFYQVQERVHCGVCGAAAGYYCRNASSNRAPSPHADRIRLYKAVRALNSPSSSN